MASRTFELGELKVTVEAPEEELADAFRGMMSIRPGSALAFERTVEAAGGLKAFMPVDTTADAIHGYMKAGEEHGRMLMLFVYPPQPERPTNPVMADLRRDQEAELAQARASEAVPD